MLDHNDLYFDIRTLLNLQEKNGGVTVQQLKELSQVYGVSVQAAIKCAKNEFKLKLDKKGLAGPSYVVKK